MSSKRARCWWGFHERKSRYVADMEVCPVLPPHVSAMLMPLRKLVADMDARDTCPQIELACGDHVTALVLRHLEQLTPREVAAELAISEATAGRRYLEALSHLCRVISGGGLKEG